MAVHLDTRPSMANILILSVCVYKVYNVYVEQWGLHEQVYQN